MSGLAYGPIATGVPRQNGMQQPAQLKAGLTSKGQPRSCLQFCQPCLWPSISFAARPGKSIRRGLCPEPIRSSAFFQIKSAMLRHQGYVSHHPCDPRGPSNCYSWRSPTAPWLPAQPCAPLEEPAYPAKRLLED